MSIGLTVKLTETAQRVSRTTNAGGDSVYTTGVAEPCLYRDISKYTHTGQTPAVTYDGWLWFDADSDVATEDIYYLPNEGAYVKVDEVVRAKRLVGTDHSVMFIKCGVSKHRQVS